MNRKSLSALSLVIALTGAALTVSTQVASASAPSPRGSSFKAPLAKPASAAQARAALRSGKVPQSTSLAPVSGYVQVASSTFTDPANSQVVGTVTCPSGTKVIGGGGVVTSNSVNQNLNGSFPVGSSTTSWGVYVNNADSVDGTFIVYATCAKKIKKYSVVTSTPLTNPSGAQTQAVASCPKGTVVLGGGGLGSSNSTAVNLNSSLPQGGASTSQSKWRADINNGSAGSNTATAYAVCGGKLTGYTQVAGTTVTNPAGNQTYAPAYCPSGTVPLGGGAFSGSPSVQVNLNSTFPGSGAWNSYENNASDADASVAGYAVCSS